MIPGTLTGRGLPEIRVLIVEDARAEVETLADIVAHHGHHAIVAASAETALDSLVLSIPELQALTRRFTEDFLRINQRRDPRVSSLLGCESGGTVAGQSRGRSVDLSPFGLKVAPGSGVEPGGTVRLSFTPPDGEPLISVLSLVVRKDRDGDAFTFVNLTNRDFVRLKKFVDSRLKQSA